MDYGPSFLKGATVNLFIMCLYHWGLSSHQSEHLPTDSNTVSSRIPILCEDYVDSWGLDELSSNWSIFSVYNRVLRFEPSVRRIF